MGIRHTGSWAKAITLAAMLPALVGATGLTTNIQGRLLAGHNRERASLGIPPLRWDDGLARDARRWAAHLAETGSFSHAPENPLQPQGENLWAGSRGAYPIESMVEAWVREKRYFKTGAFPHVSVTGRVTDVDHYTQLMWRETDAVGCAIVAGAQEDVLVCRYSQAGNYRGEQPF